MRKNFIYFFVITILFLSSAYGQNKDKIVKLVANNIIQENDTITATGNVLLFSPNYYITAQKLIYDKNQSTIEAFDDVSIVESKKQKNITNYAFLDMKNEIDILTPILLIDEKAKVWLNAKNYDRKDDVKYLTEGTLSSCDCTNPEWSYTFGSADFNSTKQWINTYNNTLYFGSMPAWYLAVPFIPTMSAESLILSILVLKSPYFGFPTNDDRRTGLLIPKIAHDDTEGWSYLQPIYYAPQKNYDFEYIPQIREKRGYGHELRFRYADSAYSKLLISTGKFYEKDSYFENQDLVNQEHYGTSLNYNRTKLFSHNDSRDGLYVDLKTLNDVEYLKTQYDYDSSITINKLQLSQVEYFYDYQDYHFNIGIRKYDDISKENDDDVMQTEPYSQFFKYSKNTFIDKLFYNFDIKQYRYTRKEGIAGDKLNISAPFKYQTYFLDNFLLLGLKKEYDFQGIDYKNNESGFENGRILKSTDSISLETDLVKPFESFIHALSFKTQYNHINYHNDKGDLYGYNTTDSNLSVFSYDKELDNIDFLLNQVFYNTNKSQIFSHQMKQKIVLNDDGSSDLDNLENSLVFYLPNTTLSNKFEYNHEDDKIVSSSYKLRFKKGNDFFNYDYSESYDSDNTKQKSSVLETGTTFLRNYTVKFKDTYDIDESESTLREVSLNINKKCWAVDIKLSDALVATATNTAKAKRQDTIYITYTFKPLGSLDHTHVQDTREE